MTTGAGIHQEFLRLRARIVQEMFVEQWRDVWFFPDWNGVQGWQGTRNVFLVALAPNFGRFPTAADRFLYGELKAHDLAQAHLTDLMKTRMRNYEADNAIREGDFREHKDYFRYEIETVQPKLIIALGRITEDCLANGGWLPTDISVSYVPHYAYSHRYNQQEKFCRKLHEACGRAHGPGEGRGDG